MAGVFKATSHSSVLGTDLTFETQMPDGLEREYTTYVNTGIAAIFAKAGDAILEGSGDTGDVLAARKSLRKMAKEFEAQAARIEPEPTKK